MVWMLTEACCTATATATTAAAAATSIIFAASIMTRTAT